MQPCGSATRRALERGESDARCRDVALRWSGAPRSISLGKRSKSTLRLPVPPHPCQGIPPPTPHLSQRTLVRVIAAGDHVFQVFVLRFDHLIRIVPVVREVAWSTQL